jgi:hypothetical protein
MFQSGSSLLVSNSLITKNIAAWGGGICAKGGPIITLYATNITHNTAAAHDADGKSGFGGGLYIDTISSLLVLNCLIAYNSAGVSIPPF